MPRHVTETENHTLGGVITFSQDPVYNGPTDPLARANHTGTQAPATISPQGTGSGLDADTVDGVEASALELLANKDAANGYAGLSASSKIALAQLTGVMASSDLTNDAALEKVASKNAASGYAGLDGASKLTPSQMTELIASSDLTDFEGAVNAANGAVKLDGSGLLPALNGSALTNLPAPQFGSHKLNLVVSNNATNPNFQVDVDADELAVEGVLLSSVNLTADITASGADGLDTGTEAASTWYSIWVISNSDGTLSASLLSTSSSTPTLPGSYTRKRRVGWVYNNSVNNFSLFIHEGNKWWSNEIGTSVDSATLSSNSWSSALTGARNWVPPGIRNMSATLSAQNPSAVTNAEFQVAARPAGSNWDTNRIHVKYGRLSAGSGENIVISGQVKFLLDANRDYEVLIGTAFVQANTQYSVQFAYYEDDV